MQQTGILRSSSGLVLQERGVATNASETKDFPNGVSLFFRSDFCHLLSC